MQKGTFREWDQSLGWSLDINDTGTSFYLYCTSSSSNDVSKWTLNWRDNNLEYRAIRQLCQSRGYSADLVLGHKSRPPAGWILLELYEEWYAYYKIGLQGIAKHQQYSESRITKLQTFAWKIKDPQKIHHLIWQTISGQLDVTSNLTHRHIWCDNHYPKLLNIFECHLWIPAGFTNMLSSSNHVSTFTIPQRKSTHKYGLSIMAKEWYRRPWVG